MTSLLSFDSVLDESVIQRNIRIRYERELIYVSWKLPLVSITVLCLFIHFIDKHLSYVPCFRLSQEVSWFRSTRTRCSTSTDWTWSRSTRDAHWAPCLRKSLLYDVDPVQFYKSYAFICLCMNVVSFQTPLCNWKCILWKDDERHREPSSSDQVRPSQLLWMFS